MPVGSFRPGPSVVHAHCDVVALSSMRSTSDLSSELNTLTHEKIDFVETSEDVDQTTCNQRQMQIQKSTQCVFVFVFVCVCVCVSVSWGWQGRAESEKGLSSPVPDQQRSSSCFPVCFVGFPAAHLSFVCSSRGGGRLRPSQVWQVQSKVVDSGLVSQLGSNCRE